MRYFIIGYKSCGKTTMGKKLANRLQMKFIDLDEVIEQREGKSIPELYTAIGDTEFRIIEREALKSIIDTENAVISLGGGAPCYFDNMDLMEEHGEVIYIRLDNDTLVSRLKNATKDRPIVLNKSETELREYIEELRTRREPFYLRAKHYIDGKDLTIEKMMKQLDLE